MDPRPDKFGRFIDGFLTISPYQHFRNKLLWNVLVTKRVDRNFKHERINVMTDTALNAAHLARTRFLENEASMVQYHKEEKERRKALKNRDIGHIKPISSEESSDL